jgi:hypothetical protein
MFAEFIAFIVVIFIVILIALFLKPAGAPVKPAGGGNPDKPSFKKENFETELNFMYTGIADHIAQV